MTPGSQTICWGLAVAVAVTPLPFGSVFPVSKAVVEITILVLAFIWITLRKKAGYSPLPWKDPLLISGGALMVYGLFQILPLPARFVSLISPHTGSMMAEYSVEPSSWLSLSLDPYATWHSCLMIACWTLAAVMTRHNAIDLKGRLTVAGGLVAGGLFQAGYGLFEFISGRQHIFGYQKEFFTDVATGTFISRNNYAGYLEMIVPMALALALLSLGRAGSERKRMSLKQRLAAATGHASFRSLLFLMCAFLMATALLMSRSRMGIISTAFALVVGGLVLGMQGRARRFAFASIVVAVLVVGFASQIDLLPLKNRFRALEDVFGVGGYGRWQVWNQAMPMLAASPVFGTGMGTWEAAFSSFRDDKTQVRVDFAHNDYLEFAAENGLMGYLLLASGAYLVLKKPASGRNARGPQDEIALAAGVGLVAIGLHSFTDFHLSIPADALTVVVLIGLLMRPTGPSNAFTASSMNTPGKIGPQHGPLTTWVLCVGLLVVLGLAAASPAVADARARAVNPDPHDIDTEDLGFQDSSAAAPDSDPCPACRLSPFEAHRYVESAAVARRRLLRDVEVLVRARTAGEQTDPTVKVYLADRIDRALELAEHAIRLAPINARAHLEAGLLAFGRFALIGIPPVTSNDFDHALDEFAKSLSLEPWRVGPHQKVARMLLPLWDQCGDTQQTFIERTARRADEIDPSANDIKEGLARIQRL